MKLVIKEKTRPIRKSYPLVLKEENLAKATVQPFTAKRHGKLTRIAGWFMPEKAYKPDVSGATSFIDDSLGLDKYRELLSSEPKSATYFLEAVNNIFLEITNAGRESLSKMMRSNPAGVKRLMNAVFDKVNADVKNQGVSLRTAEAKGAYGEVKTLTAEEFDKNGGYTIGVGAKEKLYTLRHEYNENYYTKNERGEVADVRVIRRSYFIRNLGKDWEDVVRKLPSVMQEVAPGIEAKVYLPGYSGKLDPNMKPHFYEDNEFWFGKHQGKSLEDVKKENPQYLIWLAEEFSTNDSRKQAFLTKIKEMMQSELDQRAKERAEAKAREEEKKVVSAGRLKELADVISLYQGQFASSLAGDLRVGRPLEEMSGKVVDILRDMYSKNFGRRGSKAYNKAFDEFEKFYEAEVPKAEEPKSTYYRDIVGDKVHGIDPKTGKTFKGTVNQIEEDGILVGLDTGGILKVPFGYVRLQPEPGDLPPLHAKEPEQLYGVKFVQPARAKQRENIVWVDVGKFDQEWNKDEGFYIGAGGVGAKISNRYERFQEFLKTGQPVEMPEVSLREFEIRGSRIGFVNGRHRFAVLRDMGLKSIPVSISKKEADEFKELFGGTNG